MQKEKHEGLLSTFQYAWQGIKSAVRTEKNIGIHLLITLTVVGAGIAFRISKTEWLIILLCIGCVLATEMMNTAIEKLADIISVAKNEKIKMVKDISAGAVLIMAIISFFTGLIIFLPHILKVISKLLLF